MALIECPECGGRVSDQAPTCIHCGFPLPRSVNPPLVENPQVTRDVGQLSVRQSITAEHDTRTPNDLVGAAQRAQAERLSHAERLHAEGRYTATQLSEFRRASEDDLAQDLAVRGQQSRWDWKRIANFTSRTRRVEFWASYAIAIASLWGGFIVDALIFGESGAFFFSIVGIILWLWLLVGSSVNRLHDIGRRGWWFLLGLVPVASLVLLAWVGFERSGNESNQWGPPIA